MNHQTGIENPFIGSALFSHAIDDRPQNLLDNPLMDLIRHDGCGRISSHPARVGTLVSIEVRLMILGRRHRKDGLSIRKSNIRRFLSYKVFLDHHSISSHSEYLLHHDLINRLDSLLYGFADDHSLACCQTISLDHDGSSLLANIFHLFFWLIT